YPPGHPLYNKYQTPSQRTSQGNKTGRTINLVSSEPLPQMDSTTLTSNPHNLATPATPTNAYVNAKSGAPHDAQQLHRLK
ncbi:hypothetical protein Tco_1074156, partial [Tanacetum coccineum]